jgi:hypothetical protein
MIADCEGLSFCHVNVQVDYCSSYHNVCGGAASAGAPSRALLAFREDDVLGVVDEIMTYPTRLSCLPESQAIQITDCSGVVLASFGPYPGLAFTMAARARPSLGPTFASVPRELLLAWTL